MLAPFEELLAFHDAGIFGHVLVIAGAQHGIELFVTEVDELDLVSCLAGGIGVGVG
nr:hypothetical protein [Trueperella pecoris]